MVQSEIVPSSYWNYPKIGQEVSTDFKIFIITFAVLISFEFKDTWLFYIFQNYL